MATQETYLLPFINGMQTMAERFIQISQFDKTITAEIVEIDEDTPHHYLVSTTGCSRLSVYSFESDNTKYKIKDTVYITVPNGDFSSSEKYIIGKTNKINYQSIIQSLDDILVSPYNKTTNIDQVITNVNRYSTLIIEFTPKITINIQNNNKKNIILQETVFPFTVSGNLKNKYQKVSNYWSTKNLYGNIFDDLVSNKQRITITELRDFENIQISWEKISQTNIPILTYQNQETGNTAEIVLEDITYYYGYSQEEFNNNEVNGATIIQTHNGPKIFCRNSYYINNLSLLEEELGKNVLIDVDTYSAYWPNQEEAFEYISNLYIDENIDLEKNYNAWNSFPVLIESLSSLYTWFLELYKRDYMLKEQTNKYIPPFWNQIKSYTNSAENIDIADEQYINDSYYNTLACLVCQWYDITDYETISNWYDEEYKKLVKDTSLSYEEYNEKINELEQNYKNKYNTIIKQKVIYDILE